MKFNRIAVIIPTFNPTDKLELLVNELKKNEFENIIIVNDGSIDDTVLYKLKVHKILGHGFNMGKGQALKSGFEYAMRLDIDGVVTLDDDLQHHISDVVKMCEFFLKENAIYFGIRSFDKAPITRRWANELTAKVFNKVYDYDLKDTQCGLRIYPKWILSKLISIKGDRFEYEMNQLKFLVMNNYEIKKIPIKTIYGGKSHFNGFVDSFKVIKNLFDKKI